MDEWRRRVEGWKREEKVYTSGEDNIRMEEGEEEWRRREEKVEERRR